MTRRVTDPVTVLEHTEWWIHATVPRQSSNPEPFHVDWMHDTWFCTCWKNRPDRPCRHVTAVQEHLAAATPASTATAEQQVSR